MDAMKFDSYIFDNNGFQLSSYSDTFSLSSSPSSPCDSLLSQSLDFSLLTTAADLEGRAYNHHNRSLSSSSADTIFSNDSGMSQCTDLDCKSPLSTVYRANDLLLPISSSSLDLLQSSDSNLSFTPSLTGSNGSPALQRLSFNPQDAYTQNQNPHINYPSSMHRFRSSAPTNLLAHAYTKCTPYFSTKTSICPKPRRKAPRKDLPKLFTCPVLGCARSYALDNSLRQHIRHFHRLHCTGSKRVKFLDCDFLWDLCMKTDSPPAWCANDLAKIKIELQSLVDDSNIMDAPNQEAVAIEV